MLRVITNTYERLDPWYSREHCPIELDMGCGKGGFLLQLAERFPDRLILGSDVMLGRLRRVQRKVERRCLANVELLRASNLELVGYQLPDSCVTRLHLLCPDPWPKTRHRARRLVTSDFLARVARVLVPGGVLHLSTDHVPYLAVLRQCVESLTLFAAAPGEIADIADIRTDFERKWLEAGKSVPHLGYRCLE